MSSSDLNMTGDSHALRAEQMLAARSTAKRTAIVLSLIAGVWYFGFMGLRLL
jgi:hypothetical protein